MIEVCKGLTKRDRERERERDGWGGALLILLPAEKVPSKVSKLSAKKSLSQLAVHSINFAPLSVHLHLCHSISSPCCNKAINFENTPRGFSSPGSAFPHTLPIVDERHLWHGPVKKKNIGASSYSTELVIVFKWNSFVLGHGQLAAIQQFSRSVPNQSNNQAMFINSAQYRQ